MLIPIKKTSLNNDYVFRRFLYALENIFFAPLKRLNRRNPALFILVLIALPVILFNTIHVFGPKYLLHDDSFRASVSAMPGYDVGIMGEVVNYDVEEDEPGHS